MEDTDPSRDFRVFGATIRRLRADRRYSQEGFADACGLDRTYIGGIERGERNPSLKNLLKMARTLRIPPAELLRDLVDEGGDD
ncbi:transcriptional regulator [Roseovarius sp. TE539]|uniref:helix-turn-helix domain-containing protein n=1 Tax=Roseovarius sp. TE539 TaxID=2249812 RepID=UPI000DE0B1B2|nr:helix-turn-helix transcriptional regulator [Roseovarius sp. TE539]RBI74723.1 transcriptional regulator [Roseovarius sp. TE539]